MIVDFVKLHGLGNDFVFIDDLSNEHDLTDEQVIAICDRKKGVGADGVILVRPPKADGALAYMHYINSDATLAQMCGNGVRCFAKYLVDRGFSDSSESKLVADTLSGTKPIDFVTDDNGNMIEATVNMGRPRLDPSSIPTTLKSNARSEYGEECVVDASVESPWGEFRFTCVNMGNPHAVCFIDDFDMLPDELFKSDDKKLSTLDIDKIGPYFESNPIFPEKANIEFACIDDDGISMRVYERGCGETLACGTGTCATLVAAYLSGRSGRSQIVHLLGGDLHILLNDENDVMMTGPAKESFSGKLDLDSIVDSTK